MATKQQKQLLAIAGAGLVLYLIGRAQSTAAGAIAPGARYGGGWGGTPGGYFGTGENGTPWINALPINYGGSPLGSPDGSPMGTAPGTMGVV